MIEKIVGRNVDVFKNIKGDLIDGEYFTHLIYFKDYIKKFQVIQEKEDYIIVKLVLDNEESFIKNKKDFDDIKDKIKLVMGNSIEIKYILVNDILPTTSGKYRYTISKV